MSYLYRQRILSSIDELPCLSPAVQEIITLANDLSASPKDLLDIIRTDPVLTAKILKLVNSAYFSLNSEVASLNRAIVLLGFNTIKNVAISAELVKLTERSPNNPYFNYRSLWEHMLGVGAVGKFIAKEMGKTRNHLEEFFIAGLIHDLGDFLLMRFLPEEFHKIRQQAFKDEVAVRECSRDVLGFSSSDVGAELADHWKLQGHLKRVICSMEKVDEMEDPLDRVIFVADHFCRKNRVGYVDDENFPDAQDGMMSELGLSDDFLDSNKDSILQEVERAKVFIA